jgi:16S rRNA (guanine527-N7)-methyltransferase
MDHAIMMTRPPVGSDKIAALLEGCLPRDAKIPNRLYEQLAVYLQLLLKWNARTNLSAIRDPEEIVRRHFGESLFAAHQLSLGGLRRETLLDFGSGAGFPGLPIQLLCPGMRVTLGESQSKKAAFLREAVRALGLDTEVWPARVEAMPQDRQFDVVALRAVDRMNLAVAAAAPRAARAILLMTTTGRSVSELPGFTLESRLRVPGSTAQELILLNRQA